MEDEHLPNLDAMELGDQLCSIQRPITAVLASGIGGCKDNVRMGKALSKAHSAASARAFACAGTDECANTLRPHAREASPLLNALSLSAVAEIQRAVGTPKPVFERFETLGGRGVDGARASARFPG